MVKTFIKYTNCAVRRRMSLSQIKVLTQQFNSSVGLPFHEILNEEWIKEILEEVGVKYRNRIFNPIVTLWAFLSQVLDKDKSCHKAGVGRLPPDC